MAPLVPSFLSPMEHHPSDVGKRKWDKHDRYVSIHEIDVGWVHDVGGGVGDDRSAHEMVLLIWKAAVD